jgi:protein-L-isoaspartate O-methyltransferase
MHAKAAEGLADFLKPGSKVLDVGSGSGYLTAVFAHSVVSFSSLYSKIVHPPLYFPIPK